MSNVKMPKDTALSRGLFRFAIGVATIFNALIGRPKVYFESEKAEFKNIPSNVLIISNHTYWLDPPNLSILFRKKLCNSVAANEVFEGGRYYLMAGLRCIPLDRNAMDLACIKECVARLKKDQRVIIFPEGQLNLTDEILDFKPGVALISMQAKCGVVPVYTSGVYRPFGGLKLIVGNPISFEELFPGAMGAKAVENATALMQERMQKLSDNLNSKLSEKDKKIQHKVRQKFAEKRIKIEEQKQTKLSEGDNNDN
ncbi:MAG: 1-acyl-sn-glycerol-3-phosphate acyltransferase [Ruminococcaceae bacterium]|nr:1-acyl-sn-glycerol-3-phosphate acyltransferase [Oscillospiraceae bacterium]